MPALSGFAPSITFDENVVNATPQLLDGDVTFTDAEGDFNGGHLNLTGVLAEDRISVRNQGTGAGQIGLSGTNVTYGGVIIGVLSGGSGTALTITFNASATTVAIDALIQNLTYADVSDTPTAGRNLVLNVTDAAGHDLITPAGAANLVQQTGANNPFDAFHSSNGSEGLTTPTFLDIDNDGDMDLVSGYGTGLLGAYRNNGNGTFTQLTGAANPFNGIHPSAPGHGGYGYNSAPTAVDIDGDGDLDLVIGGSYGDLFTVRNNGNGTFTELTGANNPFENINTAYVATPVFVDLDRDGDLDLVAGSNSSLRYWQNMGSGVYTERTGGANPLSTVHVDFRSAPAFADLDGDGDMDLIVGSYAANATGPLNSGLHAYRNNGDGTFTELVGANNPVNGIDVGEYTTPAFGDVDGDGDMDLVIGNTPGQFAFFRNTGTPSSHGVSFTVNVTPQADDVPPVIHDDAVSTNENATLNGSVFADNGSGADTDGDGPALTVSAVNGSGANVGSQITLASGALLTLNADGTFSYIPPASDAALPGPASGASNQSRVDSFTYALVGGGTATVTVTVHGVDSNDVLQGTAGVDTLDGGIGDDRIIASAGADAINGGDGIDTIDYSGASAGVTVGLNNSNAIHDGEGSADTLTNIENAIGSAFNDLLIGDGANNVLTGGTGADVLIGLDGDDRLIGGTGASNQMQGGLGDDVYVVDATDTVYELAGEGVDTVETTRNIYTLGANLERLTFTGAGAFTGTGNGLDNTLLGGSGDDALSGRGGADVLNGGGGLDTADYHLAAAGVTASLTAGAASNDGDGGSDTFVSIENLTGSTFNDTLTGSGGVNILIGGNGDDVLNGRGGNDQLFGGGGLDTASYADAAAGVTVRLNLNTATDGEGGTDSLNAIENAAGSAFDDTLYGSALANVLTGGAGYDVLLGLDGNDTIIGGSGAANELYGGAGNDTYVVTAQDTIIELSGEGTDLVQTTQLGFSLADNIENLTFTGSGNFAGIGNASANVLTGGAGLDTLTGAGGDDTLNGGDGYDTVLLSGLGGQYTIEFLGGTQYRITDHVGGRDGVDILNDIEQVRFGNGITVILNGGVPAPPEPADKHAGDALVLPGADDLFPLAASHPLAGGFMLSLSLDDDRLLTAAPWHDDPTGHYHDGGWALI